MLCIFSTSLCLTVREVLKQLVQRFFNTVGRVCCILVAKLYNFSISLSVIYDLLYFLEFKLKGYNRGPDWCATHSLSISSFKCHLTLHFCSVLCPLEPFPVKYVVCQLFRVIGVVLCV